MHMEMLNNLARKGSVVSPFVTSHPFSFAALARYIACLVVLVFLSFSNAIAQDQTISGSVSLPESITANGDIVIEITVLNVDDDGFFLGVLGDTNFTIENGRSQADFQFDVEQPSFISDLVSVTILCFSNCDAADSDMQTQFYLQDDGSFAPVANTLPISNITSPLTFQFPEIARQTLRGTVRLPDSFTRNGNVSVSLFLQEVNADGFSEGALVFENIIVSSSDRQTNFELTFIAPEPDAQLSFFIRCSAACRELDGRTSTAFFLQSDGTFDDIANLVPATELPSVVSFEFPPLVIQTITGSISLPEGIIAQSFTSISVSVSDPGLGILDPRIDEDSIFLDEGESQVNYELSFREPNPAIDYEFSIRCEFNCKDVDDETFSTFFLQNDGTFNLETNQVRASSLPELIDFQFPALPVFNPASIIPPMLLLAPDE